MHGTGFGYYRDEDGKLIKKESNCSLFVGKDVDIGLNTIIDNGSYRNTVIGEGTKIDNLVHISHNVIVGKHCIITAGCVFGGSSEFGDYSYIGLNSTVKDHVKIGKHCIIGAGSVVINNLPDNSIVAGAPAKPITSNLTEKELFNMAFVRK